MQMSHVYLSRCKCTGAYKIHLHASHRCWRHGCTDSMHLKCCTLLQLPSVHNVHQKQRSSAMDMCQEACAKPQQQRKVMAELLHIYKHKVGKHLTRLILFVQLHKSCCF